MRAVTLASLLALLGVAAAGFAGGDAEAGFVPTTIEEFGVPEPRVGDAGVYSRVPDQWTGEATTVADWERHAFGFRWLPDGEMYDGRGVHHWTNELHFTSGEAAFAYGGNHSARLFYDQVTHRLVARTDSLAGTDSQAGALPNTQHVRARFGNVTMFAGADTSGVLMDDTIRCGLLHPLQGAVRSVTFGWVGDVCSMDWWATVPPVPYRFLGAVESDGHVFADYGVPAGHVEGIGSGYVPEYRFRDDIPYPVQITYHTPNVPGPQNITLALQAFERGTGAALGARASDEAPLPVVKLVATPEWGIDETGFAHPYPLSVAYVQARDDPQDARLRDFLATHEDAYVGWAHFDEDHRDAQVWRRWVIDVTDGVEQVRVCPMQKRVRPGIAGEPAMEVPVTIPIDPVKPLVDCTTDDPVRKPDGYVPSRRPSLESMAAVWSKLAPLLGAHRDPNGYEVQVWDADDGRIFEKVSLGVELIRYSEARAFLAPVAPSDVDRVMWSLDFGPDGSVRQFHVGWMNETTGPAEPATGSPGGAAPLASLSGSVGPALPVWKWPEATQASAVGAVAVTAGLLYWLWPWLKTLAVPLFSRVDRPRALTHPKRAEILAVVDAEPGVHFEEVRRRTGLAMGALQHHLAKLEENGLVTRRRANGYLCLFPPGVDTGTMEKASTRRSPMAQEIAAMLDAHPDATPSEIAEELGMSRQAVHYHLKRMRTGSPD